MREPKCWEEAAQAVADEIVGLLVKRQHDYGHQNILAFGEKGILVRANDKVARLRNLVWNSKEPQAERVDDSWMDLAGYSIVALLLRRGWFTLELKDA